MYFKLKFAFYSLNEVVEMAPCGSIIYILVYTQEQGESCIRISNSRDTGETVT